jgi:hypothetical protein
MAGHQFPGLFKRVNHSSAETSPYHAWSHGQTEWSWAIQYILGDRSNTMIRYGQTSEANDFARGTGWSSAVVQPSFNEYNPQESDYMSAATATPKMP